MAVHAVVLRSDAVSEQVVKRRVLRHVIAVRPHPFTDRDVANRRARKCHVPKLCLKRLRGLERRKLRLWVVEGEVVDHRFGYHYVQSGKRLASFVLTRGSPPYSFCKCAIKRTSPLSGLTTCGPPVHAGPILPWLDGAVAFHPSSGFRRLLYFSRRGRGDGLVRGARKCVFNREMYNRLRWKAGLEVERLQSARCGSLSAYVHRKDRYYVFMAGRSNAFCRGHAVQHYAVDEEGH